MRRRAAPKPKRRTVVRKPPRELDLETQVVYRDRRGREVPRGTKGADRSVYEWEIDARTRKRVRLISKVEPDFVEKLGRVDGEGIDMGRIDAALVNSSATATYRDAQVIEFAIKGRDQRGKTRRFKTSIDLGTVTRKRKLHRAVVGRILQELRRRGFRTNYTLSLFKQARLKGLKYRIKWKDWRALEPLSDMEIIITIFR